MLPVPDGHSPNAVSASTTSSSSSSNAFLATSNSVENSKSTSLDNVSLLYIVVTSDSKAISLYSLPSNDTEELECNRTGHCWAEPQTFSPRMKTHGSKNNRAPMTRIEDKSTSTPR